MHNGAHTDIVSALQGAKLFYLSGVDYNKWYTKGDTMNIARFISVMKFRPLQWRLSHPYFLADRIEDLTHPQKYAHTTSLSLSLSLSLAGVLSHTHACLPACLLVFL
jgi:ribosome biogenesis protein BMS1